MFVLGGACDSLRCSPVRSNATSPQAGMGSPGPPLLTKNRPAPQAAIRTAGVQILDGFTSFLRRCCSLKINTCLRSRTTLLPNVGRQRRLFLALQVPFAYPTPLGAPASPGFVLCLDPSPRPVQHPTVFALFLPQLLSETPPGGPCQAILVNCTLISEHPGPKLDNLRL